MYRGLPSDSISTGLSNFIYFFVYSFLYEAVSKRKASRAGKNVTGGAKASPTAALSALEGIVVGCLAGIVAKSCTSPLSNITVRQQTAATSSKTADKSAKGADDGSESDDSEDGTYTVTPSMIEVANDIVDENGWTGLWAGMKASVLLSVTPGITYYAFDVLRRAIIPKRHQEHPTALQTFIAGSLAASSASIITYPLILCKVSEVRRWQASLLTVLILRSTYRQSNNSSHRPVDASTNRSVTYSARRSESEASPACIKVSSRKWRKTSCLRA